MCLGCSEFCITSKNKAEKYLERLVFKCCLKSTEGIIGMQLKQEASDLTGQMGLVKEKPSNYSREENRKKTRGIL